MRDKGINKGIVQEFNTSKKGESKAFWGFRKMFWDYLTKLGVAFFDPCCDDASEAGTFPVRFNANLQRLEYWNGTDWADIPQIDETTTTTSTTTTSSTTTTTTEVPSDIRLKENIRPTGNYVAVLKEYTWDWNDTAKSLGLDSFPTTGVLAQEALEVCPELVSVGKDGFYRINFGALLKIVN